MFFIPQATLDFIVLLVHANAGGLTWNHPLSNQRINTDKTAHNMQGQKNTGRHLFRSTSGKISSTQMC